ncbi:MAG: porin [Pirellulales bacterium]
MLQRLDALEQSRASEIRSQPSAAPKPEEGWVDVSSEKWNVRLGGHVQLDYITWAHATPTINNAANYFEFRRLRLLAEGTGYGMCDFRLQLTLEPETIGENPPGFVMSPDVKDAYFSINELPWLGRFRIGNFFVPFSLEQVTNDTNNIFLERSIPTQGVFAADREVGVACYNVNAAQTFTWTYGMFFDNISDAIKERIDDNQGYRLSGRITWLPYYDEPSNGRYLIHTGLGILYTDDQDDRARFRTRPHIHEGPRLIDSGTLQASSYTTGNAEMAVVWGRVTVQSEGFLSSVQMLNGANPQIGGGYAHLSYFLTGENRIYERFGQHGAQFTRNSPYSNFFIVPGAWSPGAWEAKIRWSYLDLNSLNSGQYTDFTVGFNWYWSDRTRVMFDWIHPTTTQATTFGSTNSDILGMRFDFNW